MLARRYIVKTASYLLLVFVISGIYVVCLHIQHGATFPEYSPSELCPGRMYTVERIKMSVRHSSGFIQVAATGAVFYQCHFHLASYASQCVVRVVEYVEFAHGCVLGL